MTNRIGSTPEPHCFLPLGSDYGKVCKVCGLPDEADVHRPLGVPMVFAATPMRVEDALAALPPGVLEGMRLRNERDLAKAKSEVARLELQEEQFRLAIERKTTDG